MKLTDLYTSIISKESYDDMDVFFLSYESFEEIPLISRHNRLDQLADILGKSNTLDFLIGLSAFLLNSITTLARVKKLNEDELFIAITFTDFDNPYGSEPIIPNIFIYPNQNKENDFHQSLKNNTPNKKSIELTTIQKHFSKCNLENSFIFYESRFFDPACDEEIVRIFAVPKRSHKI
ncbi:Immunity protein 15 [Pseudomonas sp. UC 17F4]|uniref:Imm15 family immunity protein n=1 Tax=Pseudomonas sp. UC 17F4 TaxID=1855328 RepID=UPI00088E87E5|nr:Imm15 family immunity protein [Pseudomonas sp. UC 17F4]SDQ63355.1 Immunity protein 15 [Pseudomonas sp. UC 17F4]